MTDDYADSTVKKNLTVEERTYAIVPEDGFVQCPFCGVEFCVEQDLPEGRLTEQTKSYIRSMITTSHHGTLTDDVFEKYLKGITQSIVADLGYLSPEQHMGEITELANKIFNRIEKDMEIIPGFFNLRRYYQLDDKWQALKDEFTHQNE